MPDQLQLRGGTTAQHVSFTGASKEVTVDTTKKTAVVHDGATAGGNPLLREDASNSALVLGSAGTPSLKFNGDTNTGIYSPGADQVALATGGTARLTASTTALTAALPIDHPLGSAAAPGITFTGDLNTGIYSPGADQLALATNGTGRLFVASAGLVGIGTSAPDTLLHLQSSANNMLYMQSTDSIVDIIGADTTGSTRIRSQAGALAFWTGGGASTSSATSALAAVTIDTSQRVGIGTTAPATLLEVSSNTGSASPTPTEIRIATTTSAGDWSTTNPWGSLSFYSADATGGARVHASINTIANGVGGGTSSLAFYTADSGVAAAERLRINATGNVGIGTTSPATALHVQGTTSAYGNGGASLFWGNTSALGGLTYSGTDPIIQTTSGSSGNLLFLQSTTERMRLDSSGKLLVGLSTSVFNGSGVAGKIQVADTTSPAVVSLGTWLANANGSILVLGKSRSTTPGTYSIVSSGDSLGTLRFSGDDGTDLVTQAASIECFVDGTPGADDMPGRIVLSTTLDGASSPTEAFRITNDRVRCYNQAAPVAVNTTATVTVANLKTGIITSTTAAAVTMTLPTGTDCDAGFSGVYTNLTFEWAVINTGATNAVTVSGNTDHTIVGSATVAASNSGRFASRRTGANTWVTYRLSS